MCKRLKAMFLWQLEQGGGTVPELAQGGNLSRKFDGFGNPVRIYDESRVRLVYYPLQKKG